MEFLKRINIGETIIPQNNLVVYKINSFEKILIKEGTATKVTYTDNSVRNLDIDIITGTGEGSSMTSPTTNIPNVMTAKIIRVGSKITSIGHHSFWGYGNDISKNLQRVVLSDNVTTIGDFAFAGAANLTNLTLPNTITSIGNGAFINNNKMTKIVIPDGIKTLVGTFYNCVNLSNVVLPSSIEIIMNGNSSGGAFENCSSLKKITYNGTLEDLRKVRISGNPFSGANMGCDVVCTDQTIKLGDVWQ